jgi:hypothetical protein
VNLEHRHEHAAGPGDRLFLRGIPVIVIAPVDWHSHKPWLQSVPAISCTDSISSTGLVRLSEHWFVGRMEITSGDPTSPSILLGKHVIGMPSIMRALNILLRALNMIMRALNYLLMPALNYLLRALNLVLNDLLRALNNHASMGGHIRVPIFFGHWFTFLQSVAGFFFAHDSDHLRFGIERH